VCPCGAVPPAAYIAVEGRFTSSLARPLLTGTPTRSLYGEGASLKSGGVNSSGTSSLNHTAVDAPQLCVTSSSWTFIICPNLDFKFLIMWKIGAKAALLALCVDVLFYTHLASGEFYDHVFFWNVIDR